MIKVTHRPEILFDSTEEPLCKYVHVCFNGSCSAPAVCGSKVSRRERLRTTRPPQSAELTAADSQDGEAAAPPPAGEEEGLRVRPSQRAGTEVAIIS